MRRILLFWTISLILAAQSRKEASRRSRPVYASVSDPIVAEFDKHELIALGNFHDRREDQDLLTAVIHNRNFPTKVHNIVYESGNALYQRVLDQYIAGEQVPLQDVQKVWRDTTQSPVAPATFPGYDPFLTDIRQLNQHLPARLRLRVLAGDPPIDWTKVRSKQDFLGFLNSRDKFPAHLIEREILSKGEKALILYGAGHIWRNVSNLPPNLAEIIDKDSPGKLFTVIRIGGVFPDTAKLEELVGARQRPVLLLLPHTAIGELNANEFVGRDIPIKLFPEHLGMSGAADACVYSGKKQDVTVQTSSSPPLDSIYAAELDRRRKLIPGGGR